MMFRLAAAASASLIAIAVSLPAGASTITVSNITFSDGSREINIGGAPAGVPKRVDAGRFQVTTTTEALFLWCVDIFNQVTTGPQIPRLVYTIGTLEDDNAPGGPNALTDDQKSRVSGLAAAGDAALAGDPSNAAVVSAAYQAAIWQTIYPTFTFKANISTSPLQLLINELNDEIFSGGTGTLYTPTDAQGDVISQKLFTGNGPDPVEPIPGPAAIGLFGFALAGLLLARRATA
jgi:hypothetical protein